MFTVHYYLIMNILIVTITRHKSLKG
uniref:Uncharacterized protein n=1 Tax=Heterorhabditis bacteriophora TaxID=37862 RepID=A0A1I7X1F9_HETBA